MNKLSQQRAEFVDQVWLCLLGRVPDNATRDWLVRSIEEGRPERDIFTNVYNSDEAVRRREISVEEKQLLFVPPGHYYSPIVDVSSLSRSQFRENRFHDGLRGINIDFESMHVLIEEIIHIMKDFYFPFKKDSMFRYYFDNEMFGIGDAIILSGIIQKFKPRRIIEVGSGFSSAVMLDTLERMPSHKCVLTFVEPYPHRLRTLLRSNDEFAVEIFEKPVQEFPIDRFDNLEAGDILFLDTTHVSKTGSDVNHELFHIIPRLKSGVIVHFHDIFDGFEYIDQWIFDENRSWNEIYLIRAFLMYNTEFSILYANHAMHARRNLIDDNYVSRIGKNPGGGLWLTRK